MAAEIHCPHCIAHMCHLLRVHLSSCMHISLEYCPYRATFIWRYIRHDQIWCKGCEEGGLMARKMRRQGERTKQRYVVLITSWSLTLIKLITLAMTHHSSKRGSGYSQWTASFDGQLLWHGCLSDDSDEFPWAFIQEPVVKVTLAFVSTSCSRVRTERLVYLIPHLNLHALQYSALHLVRVDISANERSMSTFERIGFKHIPHLCDLIWRKWYHLSASVNMICPVEKRKTHTFGILHMKTKLFIPLGLGFSFQSPSPAGVVRRVSATSSLSSVKATSDPGKCPPGLIALTPVSLPSLPGMLTSVVPFSMKLL